MPLAPPRLVVSATGGDGGKTLVSIGLTAHWASEGLVVSPFKKGPDYIDSAWLALAARRPCRNLDTFMTGEAGVLEGFARGAGGVDLALVEGNRGLHDGMDAEGTHSTAALARVLSAPVVLVLDATKATRTLAAVALGCQLLEPSAPIGAIVLNKVATARHEAVARRSVESATGIPVLGAIPRRAGGGPLPGRHLGLVTPDEHRLAREAVETAREMVAGSVDTGRLLAVARAAQRLELPESRSRAAASPPRVVIGVVRDSAFSFYYPESLEALERAGARLEPVSSLESRELPEALDALYVGGGFPETHASAIAANGAFLASLRTRVEEGLPVYAECGGLMLLARSLEWRGEVHEMAGVLSVDVVVEPRPQGHGYCVVRVDRENPFFEVGTVIRAHEFHYSTVKRPSEISTAFAVERGTGCFDNRDGLLYKNVLASYAHLHALGAPEWADGLVARALEHQQRRASTGGRARADQE